MGYLTYVTFFKHSVKKIKQEKYLAETYLSHRNFYKPPDLTKITEFFFFSTNFFIIIPNCRVTWENKMALLQKQKFVYCLKYLLTWSSFCFFKDFRHKIKILHISKVAGSDLGGLAGAIPSSHGATVPDPARPQVADSGTTFRYEGQLRITNKQSRTKRR